MLKSLQTHTQTLLGSSWVMEWSHAYLLVPSFKQLLSNMVVFVGNTTERCSQQLQQTQRDLFICGHVIPIILRCVAGITLSIYVLVVLALSSLSLARSQSWMRNTSHICLLLSFSFLLIALSVENRILFVFKVTTFVVPVNGYCLWFIIFKHVKTHLVIIDHH